MEKDDRELQKKIQANYNIDLAHQLKIGNDRAARAIVRSLDDLKYEDTFPGFMTAMLAQKKLKRTMVAQRANIDRDYAYKLLRGDKTTRERDYIIALCIGAELSLAETDKALALYPMPPLGKGGRDQIIRSGIGDRVGIDSINEWLASQDYDTLHVAPLKSNTEIGPSGSTNSRQKKLQSSHTGKNPVQRSSFMRVVNTETWYRKKSEFNGYEYLGETTLETDDGGLLYVQASFYMASATFQVSKDSWRNGDVDNSKIIERYSSEDANEEACNGLPYFDGYSYAKNEAAKSSFFRYFLELDYQTDVLVAEVVFGELEDNSFDPYHKRFGYGKDHGQVFYFVECYNDMQPELNEYYQVSRYPDKSLHYTASYGPAYDYLHLGEHIHESQGKKTPDFFVDVWNLDDVPLSKDFAVITLSHLANILAVEMVKLHAGGATFEEVFKTKQVLDRIVTMGTEEYLLARQKEKGTDSVKAAIESKSGLLNPFVWRNQCECMEGAVCAEIPIDKGKGKYAQLYISSDICSFSISTVSLKDDEWDEDNCEEIYTSMDEEQEYSREEGEDCDDYLVLLNRAKESKYSQYYLKLDELTDDFIRQHPKA